MHRDKLLDANWARQSSSGLKSGKVEPKSFNYQLKIIKNN